MKYKFNIFNLINTIMFLLAFTTLLFSYLTSVMYFVSLGFFTVSFAMLTYTLFKNYLKKKHEEKSSMETLIMELSASEDGTETYVMQEENKQRGKGFFKRIKNFFKGFDKFLPTLFSAFVTIIFIFLIVKSIFRF